MLGLVHLQRWYDTIGNLEFVTLDSDENYCRHSYSTFSKSSVEHTSRSKQSSSHRVCMVVDDLPSVLQGSFYPYYAADRRYFHYDPTWYYYPRHRPFPLYHLNYPYWPWTIGGGRSGVSRYYYVRQPIYYSGSRLANALITGKSKPLCILPLPPSIAGLLLWRHQENLHFILPALSLLYMVKSIFRTTCSPGSSPCSLL